MRYAGRPLLFSKSMKARNVLQVSPYLFITGRQTIQLLWIQQVASGLREPQPTALHGSSASADANVRSAT